MGLVVGRKSLPLSLALLAFYISISLGLTVTFSNPPDNGPTDYYVGDMVEVVWSKTVENLGLVLVQGKENNEKERSASYLYSKNASIGPKIHSWVWTVCELDDIPLHSGTRHFTYNQPSDKDPNKLYHFMMYDHFVTGSNDIPRLLGNSSTFRVMRSSKNRRTRVMLERGQIYTEGLTGAAKAGIGVGVTIGVLLIAMNVAWVVFAIKRRRQPPPPAPPSDPVPKYQDAGLPPAMFPPPFPPPFPIAPPPDSPDFDPAIHPTFPVGPPGFPGFPGFPGATFGQDPQGHPPYLPPPDSSSAHASGTASGTANGPANGPAPAQLESEARPSTSETHAKQQPAAEMQG